MSTITCAEWDNAVALPCTDFAQNNYLLVRLYHQCQWLASAVCVSRLLSPSFLLCLFACCLCAYGGWSRHRHFQWESPVALLEDELQKGSQNYACKLSCSITWRPQWCRRQSRTVDTDLYNICRSDFCHNSNSICRTSHIRLSGWTTLPLSLLVSIAQHCTSSGCSLMDAFTLRMYLHSVEMTITLMQK